MSGSSSATTISLWCGCRADSMTEEYTHYVNCTGCDFVWEVNEDSADQSAYIADSYAIEHNGECEKGAVIVMDDYGREIERHHNIPEEVDNA